MQTLLSSPSSAFLSAVGAPHAPGATPSWFLLVVFTLEREEDLATLQKKLAPFVAYLKAHEPTTKSYRLLKSDKDPLRCAMTERYEDKDHAFLQARAPRPLASGAPTTARPVGAAGTPFLRRETPVEGVAGAAQPAGERAQLR